MLVYKSLKLEIIVLAMTSNQSSFFFSSPPFLFRKLGEKSVCLTHREKPCNYFYWTLFVAYYINSNDDIFIDVAINIIAILISLSMITGKC